MNDFFLIFRILRGSEIEKKKGKQANRMMKWEEKRGFMVEWREESM